jgi:hypothetical protein
MPKCGKISNKWAKVSNRHYVSSNFNFEIQRDKGSVIINFNSFSIFLINAIIIINNYLKSFKHNSLFLYHNVAHC